MKKKGIALSEIFLMVMATVAIAFILQQSFGMVSAVDTSYGIQDGRIITIDRASGGDVGAPYFVSGTANQYKGAVFDSSQDAANAAMAESSAIAGAGKNGVDGAMTLPSGTAFTAVGKGGKTLGFNVNPAPGSTTTRFTVSADKLVSGSASIDNVKQIVPGDTAGTTKVIGANGETTVVNQPIEDVKASVTKSGATVSEPLSGAAIGKGLFEGVGWAVAVGGLTYLLAGAFGAKDNLKIALTASLAVGVLAYKATSTFAQGKSQFWGGTGAIVVGVAAAALVFVLLYKDEEQKIVNFECQPYQPPLGGSQCEECNKYPFKPCSEYRCKSLGQACELLNVGTGSESCAWVSKFDVKSPIISTLDVLYPTNLRYNPDTTRPSGLGSKIVRTGGANNCLPAYAPLKFGITTNEPSQCKIDYVHTSSFKNMTFMFGESSLFLYNHTQQMKLPAPESSPNLTGSPLLKNGGTFSLYVRCQDANGNENVDEYTFGFCVDASPDTTPPVVQASSIVSGSPVQFNVSSVPIQIYTDEPATCKWSRTNKDYMDMENNMSCSNVLMKVNSDLVYPCSSNLTAVKDKETNNFYFRCKDQPNKPEKDRNVMAQSYALILRGSQPLNILRSGPNGTIYGSTDVATVNLTIETDDGANEGAAWCSYSPTGAQDSYVLMYETNNSFMHKQQLDLASGEYTYYYRCIDNGGNRAETNVTFKVFVDRAMPQVTRVYKEMPDALKVVTNEDAQCAYSLTSCNFNYSDGKAMIYNPPEIKNVLLAEWKDNSVYYIKCMDFYGNEPSPNQCNIVVSAAKLSGGN